MIKKVETKKSEGLSSGAIAGIVIGSLFVLAIAAFFINIYIKKTSKITYTPLEQRQNFIFSKNLKKGIWRPAN
jgi:hypothetical protein